MNMNEFGEIDKTIERPIVRSKLTKGYASSWAVIVLITINTISGLVYILVQWARYETIEDAIFVGLLFAATMVLAYGIRSFNKFLANKGYDFYNFVMAMVNAEEVEAAYDVLYHSVMNTRRMTISGILYGLTISTAVYLMGSWESDPVLAILLFIFMFINNFATGVAFYGLLSLFAHTFSMGRMVQINLWRVNNPSTSFLLGITRRVSILASIYIGMSLSSLIFTDILPMNELVIAYCAFAFIMIAATLFIPQIPLVNKIKEVKEKTLFEIDNQIQAAFHETLGKMRAGNLNVEMHDFESLIRVREKIEAINPWPFRFGSISAGLSILFFSAVPVIIQIALERLV